MKYIGLDNMHYDVKPLMSLNEPFNFIISPRELGKSTSFWLMLFNRFKEKDEKTIVFKRNIVDITDSYVDDIANLLNKFLRKCDRIKFVFAKGKIKEGVMNVYVFPEEQKKCVCKTENLFLRVIALSVPMIRIKSQMLPNLEWMLFDEFICNTRLGEKYLPNEVFKFQEIYNTFQRESKNLRAIFLGNPYSRYNPYFSWLGVDLQKIKIGSIIRVRSKYAIEFAKLSDELREYILNKNPLYKFDDSYTKYAFEGQAINDEGVELQPIQPDRSVLLYVFKIHNKNVGVFKCNNNITNVDADTDYLYWLKQMSDDYQTKRRYIVCFSLEDLLSGAFLIDNSRLSRFSGLTMAFRNHLVGFKDLETYYLFEELFEFMK